MCEDTIAVEEILWSPEAVKALRYLQRASYSCCFYYTVIVLQWRKSSMNVETSIHLLN